MCLLLYPPSLSSSRAIQGLWPINQQTKRWIHFCTKPTYSEWSYQNPSVFAIFAKPETKQRSFCAQSWYSKEFSCQCCTIRNNTCCKAVPTAHSIVQATRTSLPTVGPSGLYSPSNNRGPIQMKIPISAFSTSSPAEQSSTTTTRIGKLNMWI